MMNGQISVKSVVGKGSHFEMTLQAVNIAHTVQHKKPIETFNLHNIIFDKALILIVDDVDSNRYMLKEYLSQVNLEVMSVENGKEALNCMKKYHPALILMDLRMPVMDGYEVTKYLKNNAATANIPIIALSASITYNEMAKFKACGFNGFLSKPVDISYLLTELTHYLSYTKKETNEASPKITDMTHALQPETIANLASLQIAIEQKLIPLWKKANTTMTMDIVNEFAENMITLAHEYQIPAFFDYAKLLQESTYTFDIAYIQHALKSFPTFIAPLR
jgi:polar amino acid transport system substrate-binding protein/two-component system sensor histidine kinase EvgS